ncbi:MAG: glycosyltransferase family 2 protein [Erysipelotrichaceae bacterium]
MTKFSVIVPVYNVEKYISKCVESVKEQTLTDFECLIIDDGTKDNSIEKAIEVIGDDERFKIYHKVNGGLSDARNYGIDKATGEYLFFLDSDDYIGNTLLEDTYNMAKKYDSDIVCFDMMYVYDNGEEKISYGADFECKSYKDDNSVIFINNSSNNKIYRRIFMNDKRFIKGMWYEDLAVIPVWLSKANNVSHVSKPLYYYLQREGSISHSADPRIFDIYRALNIIKEQLNTDLTDLYLDNCLIMTTLRIRDIEDRNMRIDFYNKHINYLDNDCPKWYDAMKEKNYNIKQKIVFFLLKHRMIKLLDRLY